MDRFKFRTYIKYAKLLEDVDSFFIDNLKEKITFHFSSGHTKTMKLSDCDLEQCIGQKDKNGKLIYENDIVKDINGHYGYIKWDSEELKYFVCKRLGLVPYLTPCSMVHSYEYEIVGNIHQNNELLNDNK